MFARILTLQLKANSVDALTKVIEEEIVPLLKAQDGFRDHMFFVRMDETEATGISISNRKESADAYARSAYALVLDALMNFIDGVPRAKSYEVVNSTLKTLAPIVAF